jgi:anti-anti-sigma factor
MEIAKRDVAGAVELEVSGRLDAYWADHLGAAIEDSVQAGGHRLRLDMAGVVYMSSAGIRVLLRVRKQLQALGGAFAVVNPSAAVRGVLEMVGLQVLFAEPDAPPTPAPAAARFVSGEVELDVVERGRRSGGECRLIGDPAHLTAERASPPLVRLVVEPSMLALGIGAIADEALDARARCGEYLAAGGTAAYLPGDANGVPDYVVSQGALQPSLDIVYALACDMHGAALVRFDAGAGNSLGLNALLSACLELSGAAAAGIVAVAESAGLIGAALRRSPFGAAAANHLALEFPAVRDWIAFTPERCHLHSVSLVGGIVSRPVEGPLREFVRPLAIDNRLVGHLHAAVFRYRPLRKGALDLAATVGGLFEDGAPLALLHLLNDDRPIVGGGESLMVRGACWIVPIERITHEGARR